MPHPSTHDARLGRFCPWPHVPVVIDDVPSRVGNVIEIVVDDYSMSGVAQVSEERSIIVSDVILVSEGSKSKVTTRSADVPFCTAISVP